MYTHADEKVDQIAHAPDHGHIGIGLEEHLQHQVRPVRGDGVRHFIRICNA